MHELSITQSMFELVIEQAKKEKASKVTSVNLVIGEITGVVSESVQFYFDLLSKDSIAENTQLNIKMVPCVVHCRKCNRNSNLDKSEYICPYCKRHELEIISGEELFVESIEVQ